MKNSINKFLKSNDTGLYLIDMPTGTGKTYKAIEYIYDNYNEVDKIFFITSLQKNVKDAYNELKERFVRDGKLEEFNNNVLRILSNVDRVIEELPNVQVNPNDKIFKFQSYRELINEIKIYNGTQNDIFGLKERIKDEIREKYEPQFRRDIRNYINSKCKNTREKKKFIFENHNWLIDVYPSILTNYRKIYFMTVDKFYLGNDPIIEPAYKFCDNNNLMKNSLIFIDEVDATKNTILNRQIDESLKNKIDFIHLFLTIHSALTNKDFPKIMLKNSSSNYKNPEDIILKMKDVFNEVFDKYNMQYSFINENKDNERKYIYDANTLITIFNGSKDDLYVYSSEKEKYNKIMKSKKKNSESLNKVISDVTGAISYFINGCGILAFNYCNLYNNEKKPEDDTMRIEDAISSIVKAFNVRDKYVRYISNAILNKVVSKNSVKASIKTDVYETGFRYFEFNDSIDNNLSTNISMYDLNDSPENFLLKLTNKSHVVGLSATSTIDTCIGNYDLQFLQDNLGDKYYIPSDEEKAEIDQYVNEQLSENKSNVTVEVINANDIKDCLKLLFKNDSNIEKLLNKNKLENPNDNKNYNFKRFLKVCLSIKKFMLSESKSMLILCNRNLKNEGLFSMSQFNWIIEKICSEEQIDNIYRIVNLITRDFEQSRTDYQEYLKNGNKVIIFSSYPTTGAGQNLQYENEEENIKEDIQSIYVESPTNILVNTTNFNETTTADLIKYIFQVESFKATGEITHKDKLICIKEAFLRMDNPSYFVNHNSLYKLNSTKNQALSILIQAIGRICRTRHKTADSFIYLDYDILNLDLEIVRSRRLNKEFIAILDYVKGLNINNKNTHDYICNIQQAINRNRDINNFIQTLIRRKTWTEENMIFWQDLRDFVLKHPTITEEEVKNTKFKKIYFNSEQKIDHYFYSQKNDYGDITLNPIEDKDNKLEMSMEDCNLNILMDISPIKEYFTKNGYATSFEENNLIMLPVIYNNVYKGALGEVVGRKLLEMIDCYVEEIKEGDKFEKFDYHCKNVYFDFKNWNNKGQKLELVKIKEKAKNINSKKVIIINIVGNINERIKEIEDIMIIPALIDINSKQISFEALNRIMEVIVNEN